jgi:hypothetical protein
MVSHATNQKPKISLFGDWSHYKGKIIDESMVKLGYAIENQYVFLGFSGHILIIVDFFLYLVICPFWKQIIW